MIFRILVALTLWSTAASAAVDHLVPVFAIDVPGANGSLWRSELRLYNESDAPQTVTFIRFLPFGNAQCTEPQPVILEAREMRQLRSLECDGPGAVAIELRAGDGVRLSSLVTNVAPASVQDPSCCYSGYTQSVPVVRIDEAYSARKSVANIPVAVDSRPEEKQRHLTRVNVGLVNPNPESITIFNKLFRPTGEQNSPTTGSVIVPANSAIQLNNWFYYSPEAPIFVPNKYHGFYRLETASSHAYYLYVSIVDNATNDATLIEATTTSEPLDKD